MAPLDGFELYKKMKNVDGSLKACFITAFKDYRQEFKESFPELDEIKCFIRKPKAIEDLVTPVATILGDGQYTNYISGTSNTKNRMYGRLSLTSLLIVVLPDIGDNIAYQHGLHFC